MADFLVRGLSKRILDDLKRRAKRHGRSLQSETKQILQEAAGTLSRQEMNAILDKWSDRWKGHPPMGDSAEIIRELRQR